MQRSSTTTRWLSFIIATTAGLLVACPAQALNAQRLESGEIEQLSAVMRTLDPVIAPKKQDGTAILLTWDELYAPLTPGQRSFLDAFRALKAETLGATSHYFGELPNPPTLAPVGAEPVLKEGVSAPLDPQYLPVDVLKVYQRMMAAMEADLGRRLFVESGYRSPAYQLYLFLFYLPKHDYSITETNRFVALPGHSEHGYPPRQAIDFINHDGISGEDHPEAFEALPEYHWLLEHAKTFGFVLSYPRDNPYHTSFEPWHWHYEGK